MLRKGVVNESIYFCKGAIVNERSALRNKYVASMRRVLTSIKIKSKSEEKQKIFVFLSVLHTLFIKLCIMITF